jgi:hypothetical protein
MASIAMKAERSRLETSARGRRESGAKTAAQESQNDARKSAARPAGLGENGRK